MVSIAFIVLGLVTHLVQNADALSSKALVERFKSEKVFWRQFLIAQQIVDRRDAARAAIAKLR